MEKDGTTLFSFSLVSLCSFRFLMLLSCSLAAPFFSLDFLSSFPRPVSSFVERPLPGPRWHDRPGQVGNRLVKTVKTQNLT